MKDSRIEIRVTKEEKALIDNTAAYESLKTSTFVRKVVLDYIKEKEVK